MSKISQVAITLVIFAFMTVAWGSLGDLDPDYQDCLYSCKIQRCSLAPNLQPSEFRAEVTIAPWWTCMDVCRFECIRRISKIRESNGLLTLKYDGHWPFIRYFGLEEPASVFFSIANGLPHINNLKAVLSLSSPSNRPHYMSHWLYLYSVSGLLAWVASCVFHSFKSPLTSVIDYIFALVFLSCGLWMAFRRLVGTWGSEALRRSAIVIVGISSTIALIARIWLMIEGRVTFSSHMTLSISIVVLTLVLWAIWVFAVVDKEVDYSVMDSESAATLRTQVTAQKRFCLLCQALFIPAAMLEIFDFPPFFGIFDAHSLWHLATVPLGFMWYSFWALDKANYSLLTRHAKAT